VAIKKMVLMMSEKLTIRAMMGRLKSRYAKGRREISEGHAHTCS